MIELFTDEEFKWLSAVDMGGANNENIDIASELKIADDHKLMLRMLSWDIYCKMEATYRLCRVLGGIFSINEAQYYIAAFYANCGYLGMPHFVGKKDFLSREEKQVTHLHPMYSMEYLRAKGMNIAAYLAYMHHELPNGKGYFKQQKLAMDAPYLIHIADSYVGMLTHKSYRPAFGKKAAIKNVLQPYAHYGLFEAQMDDIEHALASTDLSSLGIL